MNDNKNPDPKFIIFGKCLYGHARETETNGQKKTHLHKTLEETVLIYLKSGKDFGEQWRRRRAALIRGLTRCFLPRRSYQATSTGADHPRRL